MCPAQAFTARGLCLLSKEQPIGGDHRKWRRKPRPLTDTNQPDPLSVKEKRPWRGLKTWGGITQHGREGSEQRP